MAEVSLYIPCYNGERFIARCIEGVMRQTHPVEEIIVVDDGSVDGTAEIASRYPVRIVRHGVNKGLAAARNTGVRSSRCDLVASVDADCIPRPDWLEKLLQGFEAGTTMPAAGVGGKLLELNRETLPDRWRTLHMRQHHRYTVPTEVLFIWGHSNVFRKSALERVGLYRESLRTNAEDKYINVKLASAGYSLVYQPEAVVDHMRTDSLASVMDNFRRWYFFGYQNDVDLTNTVLSMAKNAVVRLPWLLMEDIKARRLDCAALSLFVTCHNVLADLHYFLRHPGRKNLFDS